MVVSIVSRIKYSPLAYTLRMQQKGAQIQKVIESFVPDGKPLTNLQTEATNRILTKRGNDTFRHIVDYYAFDKTPILETHKELLDKFYQIMKEKNLDSRLLKPIKNIKTEGDLNAYLITFIQNIGKFEMTPIYREALMHKKGGFPLEYEQLVYKKKCFNEDCMATLFRMFAKPSKNPEVIEIEKILKEQYGIQAYLNNDYERAVNILNSVKKLKENNIPIPKEYIVSDFHGGGIALCTDKHTVLLGSSKTDELAKQFKQTRTVHPKEQALVDEWQKECGFDGWRSCGAKEHVETHEACHFLHFPFLAFLQQKTGKAFADTVKKLSGYVALKKDNHYEIFAELKAKSLYEPLNSKEQHLLDILEGKR